MLVGNEPYKAASNGFLRPNRVSANEGRKLKNGETGNAMLTSYGKRIVCGFVLKYGSLSFMLDIEEFFNQKKKKKDIEEFTSSKSNLHFPLDPGGRLLTI